MFTFKSSSIDEEIADKQEDTGISEKEMEDLAAILAERILQVLIFSAKFSPVITPQNLVNSHLLFQHADVTGSNSKTLNNNELNHAADMRFSLKQWFDAGAQSCRLRKSGSGHCLFRLSVQIDY